MLATSDLPQFSQEIQILKIPLKLRRKNQMRGEIGKNGRKAKEGEKGKERDLRKMEGGEKPGAKAPGRTATKGRPLPTEGG